MFVPATGTFVPILQTSANRLAYDTSSGYLFWTDFSGAIGGFPIPH